MNPPTIQSIPNLLPTLEVMNHRLNDLQYKTESYE
jgi:hypothetical protein